MSTDERRLASEAPVSLGVAKSFARKISDSGIGIVSDVFWRGDREDPLILVVMNASSTARMSGSGTMQEQDYKTLLRLRAELAGELKEGSRDVGVLYRAGFVSIPDNGQDKIDALVDGYERIELTKVD